MKLNQTIAYAVAAMSYLAGLPAGSLANNTVICQAAKLPERYVLQILRKLVNAKILVSVRGVQGGYKLAKPVNKITLLEIVEAVDGPINQSERVDLPVMSAKAATIKSLVVTVGMAMYLGNHSSRWQMRSERVSQIQMR